jgi:hypothetical protein
MMPHPLHQPIRHPAPPKFDLRGSGRAFSIVKNGQPTRRSFTRHDNAASALTREQSRARLTPRSCLSCATTFQSQGAHNRLCDACRMGDLE